MSQEDQSDAVPTTDSLGASADYQGNGGTDQNPASETTADASTVEAQVTGDASADYDNGAENEVIEPVAASPMNAEPSSADQGVAGGSDDYRVTEPTTTEPSINIPELPTTTTELPEMPSPADTNSEGTMPATTTEIPEAPTTTVPTL